MPHSNETYTPFPVLRPMTVLTPFSELKPISNFDKAFIESVHTPDSSFDDSFLFDNSHLVSSVKSVPTMTTSSPVTSEPNLPSVPPINPNSPLPSSYEANTRSAS